MLLFPEGKDPRGRLVMVSARVEGQRVFTTTVHWEDLQPMPHVVLALLYDLREQIEASREVAMNLKGVKGGSGGSTSASAAEGEQA